MNNIGKFSKQKINTSYKNALNFTKSHYENFPVISFFVPRELRKHVAIVYKFARQADDIADEGNISDEERLEQLESYELALSDSLNRKYRDNFWAALHNTITTKKLSVENFFNLLKAFKQDVIKKRYEDFEDVLAYCSNSANPVGRIILELYNINDEETILYSDSICTALQLTNFYQDVSVDYNKGRIYIPADELDEFNIDQEIFESKKNNANFKKLMELQISRTKILFKDGSKILPKLPANLSRQIKWTISGGEKILEKIEEINYDVLNNRPKLSKIDYIKLIFVNTK
ncbi:MAG: squalene synthase HpnC [Melioribacteraceae bacterium]|nr:squalene synthase HpnC [Melioribacteraceae bacterium]